MIKRMKKYFPLGFSVEIELAVIIFLLWITSWWSFCAFRVSYREDMVANCYRDCMEGFYRYIEGSVMPEFWPMLRDCFDIMLVYLAAMAGMVVYNYRYHYGEYKSIYLMRRLPNTVELHRRCFAVPIFGCICAGIMVLALIAGFYEYYCWYKPPLEYDHWDLFL